MVHSIFHEAKSEGPLYALLLNCTLKKSPETSNTEALCNLLVDRLKAHEPDIETEIVRVADYNVLPGISNDEGEGDEWPMILEKVKRCNIFVPAMPIWMGVRSSVMQRVIERLDGTTKTVMCEKTGQFPLYGSVCGCVVTGNEDGSHDCVANTFANLLHFGVTVPPNTDLYWVGDAGPGASYIEAGGDLSPYVRLDAPYHLLLGRHVLAHMFDCQLHSFHFDLIALHHLLIVFGDNDRIRVVTQKLCDE